MTKLTKLEQINSGEPTLKPEDYDFQVASDAEALKTRLEHREEIKEQLEQEVKGSIAQSALEPKTDTTEEHEGRPNPFAEGEKAQIKLANSKEDVDNAFYAAKKHYRDNADQYVENAAQEYEVVKKAETSEGSTEGEGETPETPEKPAS